MTFWFQQLKISQYWKLKITSGGIKKHGSLIQNKIQMPSESTQYTEWLKESLIPKAQRQSTSFHKRLSLTKLRGISAIAEDWGKPPCHTRDPILICQNKSQKTEVMVLTRGDYKISKSQTMRFTNIKTQLHRQHWNLILGTCGKIMCQPFNLHINMN